MAYWDQETVITTIEKNKNEQMQVKHCTMKDKTYIGFTYLKRASKDEEYKPIGGYFFPDSEWVKMRDAVDQHMESIK